MALDHETRDGTRTTKFSKLFFSTEKNYYVKITELHVNLTFNLSRWNNGCNDIYKKDH